MGVSVQSLRSCSVLVRVSRCAPVLYWRGSVAALLLCVGEYQFSRCAPVLYCQLSFTISGHYHSSQIPSMEISMSSPTQTKSNVRDQVSPEEWQARVDLAAAYRLVALYGWDDLIFT